MKIYLAGPGIDTGLFTDNKKWQGIYKYLLFSYYDLHEDRKFPFRYLAWSELINENIFSNLVGR